MELFLFAVGNFLWKSILLTQHNEADYSCIESAARDKKRRERDRNVVLKNSLLWVSYCLGWSPWVGTLLDGPPRRWQGLDCQVHWPRAQIRFEGFLSQGLSGERRLLRGLSDTDSVSREWAIPFPVPWILTPRRKLVRSKNWVEDAQGRGLIFLMGLFVGLDGSGLTSSG